MNCPYPAETEIRSELQENCDFLKREGQTSLDCRSSTRALSDLAQKFCSFSRLVQVVEEEEIPVVIEDLYTLDKDITSTSVDLVQYEQQIRDAGDDTEYLVHIYPKGTAFYRGDRMGGTGVDKLEANFPLYLADARIASMYEKLTIFETTRPLELWVLTETNFMYLCQYLNNLKDDEQILLGPVQVSALEARQIVQLYAGRTTSFSRLIDIPWHLFRINSDEGSSRLPFSIRYYNNLSSTIDSKTKLYVGRAFMHIVCSRGFDGIKVPEGLFRLNRTPFHSEYIFCNPNTHLRFIVTQP